MGFVSGGVMDGWMDLWNLGAQDAMTQIATSDHTKEKKEKNSPVVIAELHM